MKWQGLLILICVMVVAGCVSKKQASTRTREAYQAGVRQGIAQVDDARRVNIRFIGPVRHAEVIWEDGLTLVQAIATADYADPRDPTTIVIIRQRERIAVPASSLLAGKDVPLEPGDTIEIRP